MPSETSSTGNDELLKVSSRAAIKIATDLGLSFITIAVWLGLIDWLEIYLTEWVWMMNDIPHYWNLYILILLLIFLASISSKFKLISFKKSFLFLAICSLVLIAAIFSHFKYKNYYDWLQTFPKINDISKHWTIHGDRIAISGKNFGDPWKFGSVWMEDVEYTIVSWNDERIVAEQPVTGDFKKGRLIVRNEFGKEIEITPFEIRNPTEVLK